MIYTLKEYVDTFPQQGKTVSIKTIKRRILNKQLPSNHIAKKGKQYFIEVKEV